MVACAASAGVVAGVSSGVGRGSGGGVCGCSSSGATEAWFGLRRRDGVQRRELVASWGGLGLGEKFRVQGVRIAGVQRGGVARAGGAEAGAKRAPAGWGFVVWNLVLVAIRLPCEFGFSEVWGARCKWLDWG